MVLLAAAPVVSGGDWTIIKGPQGPRASAVTWDYTPDLYGQWQAKIVNNGLRSLVVDVFDNSSGIPEQISHQRIRFAAYDAYPTGTVTSDPVLMKENNPYMVTVTPNGPKGSTAMATDVFTEVIDNPPVAAFTWTATDLVVTFDASGSTDDFGVVDYAWNFGDGMTGSGMTVTHTYASAGTKAVTLTVTDGKGQTNSISHDVTVTAVVSGKSYKVYDMFQEPWGAWWDTRLPYYGTDLMITREAGANTALFMPAKSPALAYQGIIYAPYRYSIDARNVPELTVHSPEFMPVMGTSQSGAQATVDVYFQYLYQTWWNDYWIPTWSSDPMWIGNTFFPGANDGYYMGTTYAVTLNRAAALEWLNMPLADDPVAWWAANKATYTTAWNTWISNEGNVRLDIYCGYEWTYDIMYSSNKPATFMTMSTDVSGNVVLNIGHLSWGYEVLMTRWLAEKKLSTHEPWYEDFSMHAVYGEASASVLTDAVAQYSLHAVKAAGTTAGAAWVWEPNKIDYIIKPGHPSAYKPYATLTYLSPNAGDVFLGQQVPYEQTPTWFNLSAGDKLVVQLPTGVSIGYQGVALTPNDYDNLYMGDNSAFMAIRVNGLMSLGSFVTGWPSGVDLAPMYNAATKTLTIIGPQNFDNMKATTGVLYHGAPWIEFNVVP
ncbi:MAG: hypothetical protein A3K60_01535 [Euryarchaeota archaeon RBG_19FT_COMBO_56_21]|nr:MAG: hypothetical protein A3K60_01535 [Euryarchaeota archaeon RBG_19FT_COMBO_56_21]